MTLKINELLFASPPPVIPKETPIVKPTHPTQFKIRLYKKFSFKNTIQKITVPFVYA
ncbi:hypothetical protein [Galbibacter orientalis]|uniref:hypothetical protein n=1 Tax=Galbibacter orientalis TaxID=453852 RepID=UPI000314611D|nr:hypothetical protein [Galbibacter orientalis]